MPRRTASKSVSDKFAAFSDRLPDGVLHRPTEAEKGCGAGKESEEGRWVLPCVVHVPPARVRAFFCGNWKLK